MSWLDVAPPGGRQSKAGPLTRRALLIRASVAAGGALSVGAFGDDHASATTWPPTSAYSGDVPAAWFDLALDLVRTTPGFSPPVASRAFGYAGAALYEAVVPGMPGRRSFVARLNGLTWLPHAPGGALHWPTVRWRKSCEASFQRRRARTSRRLRHSSSGSSGRRAR